MARWGIAPLCALAVAAPPASAAPSAGWLATAVADVPGSAAHRYGARDDLGAPLDGLKAIRVGDQYLGVYHSPGGKSFDAHVATSTDLLTWKRRATLDTDASQPTVARAGEGYIVAYEKAFTAEVLPLTPLPPELDVVNGLAGRIRIRFRYYPTLTRLLSGDHAREFTAPRTAALTAEGTPHIERVVMKRGIGRSRVEVGLHHFADTDGDLFPDADRQGTGVLVNFRRWRDADAPAINDAFLGLQHRHAGFDAAPVGNIGDRDVLRTAEGRLAVHEAQYRPGDWSAWRIFVRDTATQAVQPIAVTTHAGSTSIGNPSATLLRGPDGNRALFVSMIVFSEGSAPGEGGPLLFWHSVPR